MKNIIKGLSQSRRQEIADVFNDAVAKIYHIGFEDGQETSIVEGSVVETAEHEGKLLRKVSRKCKTGDRVRFRGKHVAYITQGKFYEIYEIQEVAGWFMDDNGNERFIRSTVNMNDLEFEIFEVAGNKMVSLNEIALLVQQIKSCMNDSENDVLIVDIDTCHSHVQMKHIAFLIEFIDYEIKFIEDTRFPYEVSKILNGVKFVAYMNASDIVDLKTSIPDQFDYIQSKVQMDIEGGGDHGR